jgi:hypothetical protein
MLPPYADLSCQREGSVFDLLPRLATAPLRSWPAYLSLALTAVEFAPTQNRAYRLESGMIPDNGDNELLH